MCQITRRKACPTGYIAHLRDCGFKQATPISCKSILCRTCEAKRAADHQERWYPTLSKYHHLSMMTLTVKGEEKLTPQLQTLDKAFRGLLDYRLGKYNRQHIKAQVTKKLEALKTQGKDIDKLEQWRRATDKFVEMCEKREKEEGKSFKFRKLLEGISNLEITYNQECKLWHAHRHLILSMPFIPEIVLSTIWDEVTGSNGFIVDIRTVTDLKEGLKETIKYCTKFWEIPKDKEEELLQAIRNKKRLWVIGRIKPVDPEPKPCPDCKSLICKCHKVAILENGTENAILDGALYIGCLPDTIKTPVIYTISRDKKTGVTVWEATEIGRDDLSLYRTRYQVNDQPISASQTLSEVTISKSDPVKTDIPPPRPDRQPKTDRIETYDPQLQLWS